MKAQSCYRDQIRNTRIAVFSDIKSRKHPVYFLCERGAHFFAPGHVERTTIRHDIFSTFSLHFVLDALTIRERAFPMVTENSFDPVIFSYSPMKPILGALRDIPENSCGEYYFLQLEE